MKPVGLTDPETGKWPYAVVQLRQENLRADSYNLVGFQNHLKFGEQARVLRLIPGLENATFLRYGQIHRNTYINAPSLLTETLQLKAPRHPHRRPALRSRRLHRIHRHPACSPDIYAAAIAHGEAQHPRRGSPRNGSLTHYITHAEPKTSSPPTSPSICSRRSKKNSAKRSATKKSATASSANAP